MKTKKLVPSAWCLVLSAKKIIAVALCAVGFAAFAADPLGSKGNPWDIGTPTASDVEAWTNGTGRLDIDGTDAMQDFQSAAPWAGDAVMEGVVGSDVTVIGANAFAGCTALKTLVLNEQTPPTLGAGNDFAADVTIFVPDGAADADEAVVAGAVPEFGALDGPWRRCRALREELHFPADGDGDRITFATAGRARDPHAIPGPAVIAHLREGEGQSEAGFVDEVEGAAARARRRGDRARQLEPCAFDGPVHRRRQVGGVGDQRGGGVHQRLCPCDAFRCPQHGGDLP